MILGQLHILWPHAQVRWYSFQFLMEQVAEEIEELHAALTDVLQKFPHPFRLS